MIDKIESWATALQQALEVLSQMQELVEEVSMFEKE